MDLNMANRQCCNLDIREYKTNKPWMFADFCNTTTVGLSGDSVHAMKKGKKTIAFHNPMEGTMKLEFQVHPFRIYSLLSDGSIDSSSLLPVRTTIKATVEGKLTIDGDVPVAGTVFVYEAGDYAGKVIEGTFESGVFTATTAADIAANKSYEVAYYTEKVSGVKRISFNDNKIPKDYKVTMETLNKDETGTLVPMKIMAYKVSPKREFELSHSSTGEPATVTITFDILADDEGNILDITELEE